jgi:hypothetical protein
MKTHITSVKVELFRIVPRVAAIRTALLLERFSEDLDLLLRVESSRPISSATTVQGFSERAKLFPGPTWVPKAFCSFS